MNRAEVAGDLEWPNVVRPAVPILYMDLNHFINLAKARQGRVSDVKGYPELWSPAE